MFKRARFPTWLLPDECEGKPGCCCCCCCWTTCCRGKTDASVSVCSVDADAPRVRESVAAVAVKLLLTSATDVLQFVADRSPKAATAREHSRRSVGVMCVCVCVGRWTLMRLHTRASPPPPLPPFILLLPDGLREVLITGASEGFACPKLSKLNLKGEDGTITRFKKEKKSFSFQ